MTTRPKKYPNRTAVIDDLLVRYLRGFRLRRGVPGSVAQLLFGELRASLEDTSKEGERGYTVEGIHDLIPADRFGQVPALRAVEDALRELGTNILMFRAEIESWSLEIAGQNYSLFLAGPTAEARRDNDAARYRLLCDFRPVAKTEEPTDAASAPTNALPAVSTIRSLPPALRDVLRRCTVFRFAFSIDQAEFVCDADRASLDELARRDFLSVDLMTGRYLIPKTITKDPECALDPGDSKFDVVSLLHAAYFASLLFRQSRTSLTDYLPVDLRHAQSALDYLPFTMDIDIIESGDGALHERPVDLLTETFLRAVARHLECDIDDFAAAGRVYGLLAELGGMMGCKPIFEEAHEGFRRCERHLSPALRSKTNFVFWTVVGRLSGRESDAVYTPAPTLLDPDDTF
jgi:hypothetical protein